MKLSLQAWIDERIRLAIKAERETVARIIMNAAHSESNDVVYSALKNLAQDLVGEGDE